MRSLRMRLPLATILAASLTLAACGGESTGPARTKDAELLVSASVLGTPIATLVVQVSAADIAQPLVFNLTVADGIATGTVRVPPGDSRTFTVRGEDEFGNITHEGVSTVDVRSGQNPTLAIVLTPASGHVPITVTFGSVSVVISPATATITKGLSAQLLVTIHGADSRVITEPPVWATSKPSVATVSATGLVTAVSVGEADIVATYAGVAGVAHVTVVSPEVSFGNFTPFADVISVAADFLFGSFVDVPEPITLTHLGLIAGSEGSNVRLALYTDLDGSPYQLLSSTAVTPLSVGALDIPVAELALSPGRYWVMASYDQTTLVGADPAGVSKWVPWPFATALPGNFPTASLFDGTLNYYLKGKRPSP